MRRKAGQAEPRGRVAELRAVNLEEAVLGGAVRDEHHYRGQAVVIHPREQLAVQRLLELILGWNDDAAGADELPSADLLGDDLIQLMLAEIVDLDVRLPRGGDSARRQHRQTRNDLTPGQLGNRIRREAVAHAPASRFPRSLVNSASRLKMVRSATRNRSKPA